MRQVVREQVANTAQWLDSRIDPLAFVGIAEEFQLICRRQSEEPRLSLALRISHFFSIHGLEALKPFRIIDKLELSL